MLKWLLVLAVLALVGCAFGNGYPKGALTADEAMSHLGEQAMVCGVVVDSEYASSSRRKPTFLNLDKRYPAHDLTIVIWGSLRMFFPVSPETHYLDKTLCVSGKIEEFRGKAQIVATRASQIEVQ